MHHDSRHRRSSGGSKHNRQAALEAAEEIVEKKFIVVEKIVERSETSVEVLFIAELQDECANLRGRLKRRNLVIDAIRKAYLRDVVSVKNEVLAKETDPSSYDPANLTARIPSLDMRPVLELFAPSECSLRVKPCESCGGQLEIVHRESKKVVALQKSCADLQAVEQEVRLKASRTEMAALRDRRALEDLRVKSAQERDVFLQQIANLREDLAAVDVRIFEDMRKRLRDMEQEMANAGEKLDSYDTIKAKMLQLAVDAEQMKATLDANHITMRELERQRAEEQAEKEAALALVREKEAEIERHTNDNDGLTKNVSKLEEELARAKEKNERMQQMLDESRKNEAYMKQKISLMESENKDAMEREQQNQEQLENKQEEMRNELRATKKGFEQLKAKYDAAMADSATGTEAAIKASVSEATDKMQKEYEGVITNLRTELKTAVDSLDKTEKKLKAEQGLKLKSEEAYKAEKSKSFELTESVGTLEGKLADAQAKLAKVEARHAEETNSKNAIPMVRKSDYDDAIAEKVKEIVQLKEEIGALRIVLKSMNEAKEKQSKVDELREEQKAVRLAAKIAAATGEGDGGEEKKEDPAEAASAPVVPPANQSESEVVIEADSDQKEETGKGGAAKPVVVVVDGETRKFYEEKIEALQNFLDAANYDLEKTKKEINEGRTVAPPVVVESSAALQAAAASGPPHDPELEARYAELQARYTQETAELQSKLDAAMEDVKKMTSSNTEKEVAIVAATSKSEDLAKEIEEMKARFEQEKRRLELENKTANDEKLAQQKSQLDKVIYEKTELIVLLEMRIQMYEDMQKSTEAVSGEMSGAAVAQLQKQMQDNLIKMIAQRDEAQRLETSQMQDDVFEAKQELAAARAEVAKLDLIKKDLELLQIENATLKNNLLAARSVARTASQSGDMSLIGAETTNRKGSVDLLSPQAANRKVSVDLTPLAAVEVKSMDRDALEEQCEHLHQQVGESMASLKKVKEENKRLNDKIHELEIAILSSPQASVGQLVDAKVKRTSTVGGSSGGIDNQQYMTLQHKYHEVHRHLVQRVNSICDYVVKQEAFLKKDNVAFELPSVEHEVDTAIVHKFVKLLDDGAEVELSELSKMLELDLDQEVICEYVDGRFRASFRAMFAELQQFREVRDAPSAEVTGPSNVKKGVDFLAKQKEFRLTKAKEDAEKKVATLTQQLHDQTASLKQSLDELSKRSERVERDYARVQKMNEELAPKVASYDQLNNQYNQLLLASEKSKQTLEDTYQECSGLKAENKSLTTQLFKANLKVKNQEQLITDFENVVGGQKIDIAKLKKELDTETKKLNALIDAEKERLATNKEFGCQFSAVSGDAEVQTDFVSKDVTLRQTNSISGYPSKLWSTPVVTATLASKVEMQKMQQAKMMSQSMMRSVGTGGGVEEFLPRILKSSSQGGVRSTNQNT